MTPLPKIACVLSSIRICLGLDFPVSADADRAQTDDLITLQSLAGLGEDTKDQPSPFIGPVLLGKPFLGPVLVSAAKHPPQLLADVPVHPEKWVRRHHVAVAGTDYGHPEIDRRKISLYGSGE